MNANPVGSASALADRLLEWRTPSVRRRLPARELRAELVMALAFAVTAPALAAWLPASGPAFDAPLLLTFVAAYALMRRVMFPFGPGFVRPTQLVFVPMLFLLPTGVVPLAVAAGAVLGEAPDLVRHRSSAERVLVAVADSWYAVGPVLVVALGPALRPWEIYPVAFAAQFAVDVVASTLREWLGEGVRPRALWQVLGLFYLVDALLASIGLLAVAAADESPYVFLLALPPGGLLALIAAERENRIRRELELARAQRQSAEQLQLAHRRVGEAVASTFDRGALERVLLTTSVEAVKAGCGRLSARAGSAQRLIVGDDAPCAKALAAAEATPGEAVVRGEAAAIAIPFGAPQAGERRRRVDTLAVARLGEPFSPAERDLLEHLAAQAAVSLENVDLHELVQRQAITDELTGLLNHRRLQQVLEQALADAAQTRQPVALVMLDVDNFKRVNDTHGHRQGDRVLVQVAETLREASRPGDHAGRYGGEEMALVLPATTIQEARVVAERVREAIAAAALTLPDGSSLAVTASLGVAAAPTCAASRDALIEAADHAMYAAKRAGKNRTYSAPALSSSPPPALRFRALRSSV